MDDLPDTSQAQGGDKHLSTTNTRDISDEKNKQTDPIQSVDVNGNTQSKNDPDEIQPHRAGQLTEPLAEPIPKNVVPGEDFSVFTTTQKKCIIMTASMASLFSPMATAIYYPSLDTIAKDLNVSNTQLNLTVTLFLVIQGIAPSFIADLADRQGRRPMYILCFVIFTGANFGLALQKNYTALLVLRMLQSAGSSGTVALANGVVGDIITSSERGTYIAYASLASMFGPMISPILGGVIGEYAGWHWIFWFLLIFSAVVFVPLIIFMPETCRAVVGDGSIPPPLWSRNVSDAMRHRKRLETGLRVDDAKMAELRKGYRWRLPNPLGTVRVLFDLESAIILIATGLGLGCFYAISTGASVAFSENYHFTQVKTGLMFIPIGAGSIMSAFTTGKLVDWNFRRFCTALKIPIIKNRRQDLSNFPIESARLQVALPFFLLGGIVLISYGWILTISVNVAVPIILLFITGWSLTACFQILNVLMVDIYPGKPSTATAANNFVRCEIGAVFTAVLLPIRDAIGWGWTYTILAAAFLGFAPVLVVVMRRGVGWRRSRAERENLRKVERKERKDLRTV